MATPGTETVMRIPLMQVDTFAEPLSEGNPTAVPSWSSTVLPRILASGRTTALVHPGH